MGPLWESSFEGRYWNIRAGVKEFDKTFKGNLFSFNVPVGYKRDTNVLMVDP